MLRVSFVPNHPRRFPRGPLIFQKLMLPRRVHALPKALVTVSGQLSVSGTLSQRVRLQHTVGFIEITVNELFFKDDEAAVDVAGSRLRLLGKARDQLMFQLNLAKSTGRMHGGHGGQLAGLFVKIDQLVEIHGAETVAIGEHEAAAGDKLGGLPKPAAGVGPNPRIDQRDAPVFRWLFAVVKLDSLRVAQINRQVAVVITVMEKEIDECFPLVA